MKKDVKIFRCLIGLAVAAFLLSSCMPGDDSGAGSGDARQEYDSKVVPKE